MRSPPRCTPRPSAPSPAQLWWLDGDLATLPCCSKLLAATTTSSATTAPPLTPTNTRRNVSGCPPPVFITTATPTECNCKETVSYVDNTKASTGMIQHGYEGAFALVMVLSILGSLIIGGCIGVCVMNGYTSGKISPDGKSGGISMLLHSISSLRFFRQSRSILHAVARCGKGGRRYDCTVSHNTWEFLRYWLNQSHPSPTKLPLDSEIILKLLRSST